MRVKFTPSISAPIPKRFLNYIYYTVGKREKGVMTFTGGILKLWEKTVPRLLPRESKVLRLYHGPNQFIPNVYKGFEKLD